MTFVSVKLATNPVGNWSVSESWMPKQIISRLAICKLGRSLTVGRKSKSFVNLGIYLPMIQSRINQKTADLMNLEFYLIYVCKGYVRLATGHFDAQYKTVNFI